MSESETDSLAKKIFHYDPNAPAALVAGIVYAILSSILFAHVFRRKNWWGLCLPIGTVAFSVGFFMRYASTRNPSSMLLFMLNQVFLVVSPAAFIAFNYIVYGRLVRTYAAGRSGYSLIRPHLVARIFVTSDVVTFMIQGAGGGLEAQSDSANLGRVVLLTGIIAQAISYVFFVILLVYSHRKFSKDTKIDETNFPWRLVHVLHFSSVFILIRAAYRSVELIQGTSGYIASHEIFFYMLDTIPLFLATAIYTYYWPGDFFAAYSSQDYYSVRMLGVREPSP